MDRLSKDPVPPWLVSAVLVGIEIYQGELRESLPGAARDALRFAEWLRSRDVPPENITLLLAPTPDFADEAERQAAALGIRVVPATVEHIRNAFYDLARTRSHLLFTFWGGHGAIHPTGMDRHLFFSEATERDPTSLRFEDLRHLKLGREYESMRQQIFIIDACGWYLKRRDPEPIAIGFARGDNSRKGIYQYVLHASRDGQAAINNPGRGSTEFAEKVLEHLRAGPTTMPPDVEQLTKAVDSHFSDPARSAFITQTPVTIRHRNYAGSEREFGSELPRTGPLLPVAPGHLKKAVGQLHENSRLHIGRFALSQSGMGGHAGLNSINVRYGTLHAQPGVPKRATYDVVRHFYEAVPLGRLAVIGKAGSGKTVLAVRLIQELLQQRGTDEPVPVLLTLVNWKRPPDDLLSDGSQTYFDRLVRHFEGWLVDQLLTQELCDTPETAKALVRGRWVLPVLDGLDEVRASHAAQSAASQREPGDFGADGPVGQIVAAIDRYLTTTGDRPAPVIVTARATEDDGTLTGLPSACVVEMQRLSVPEIQAALTSGVPGYASDDRWRPVRNDLERGESSTAARRLDSPWKLVLAAKAITAPEPDVSASDLVSEDPGADEALHKRLLAAFIPAACRDTVVEPPTPPDPATAVRWLAELARHLDRDESENLTLSRMWLIAGARRVRVVQTVLHVMVVLFFDVACLLAAIGGPGHAAGTIGQLLDGAVDFSGPASRRTWAAGAFTVCTVIPAALTGMAYGTWVPAVSRRTRSLRDRVKGPKRKKLPLRILSGIEIGGAIGLAFGLATLLLFGWVWGIVIGSVIGVVLGYGMEAKVGLDRTLSGNFAPGYYWMWDGLSLLAGALVGTLVFWLIDYPPEVGTAFGATVGFFAAFAVGLIGWLRYVVAMSIMFTHRRLPWKVAAFLDWAHRAGVLRVHGVSWQFRHAELQAWLAAQSPPGPPARASIPQRWQRLRSVLPKPE